MPSPPSPSNESSDDFDINEFISLPSDDSASMGASSTMTFTDSLAASWFKEENGRKVQAANESYRFPSDKTAEESEQSAGEWRLLRFGLYPKAVASRIEHLLSKPQSRVLDVGQGLTGNWLIAMAEKFPNAEMIGVDTQPLSADSVPSNVSTELFDVSTELPYPDSFFDVISHSFIGFFFTEKFTYENLCNEIVRCLKPEGVYIFLETTKSSIFPENGDVMGDRFVALDKLRLAQVAITAQGPQPVCSLSQIPDDSAYFSSVLRSTDSFHPFNVKAYCTQMGSRGVDPSKDRVGEIFYHAGKKSCSPYFFLAAGYSEEEANEWTSRAIKEVEGLRRCKPGEGLLTRNSIGWAVKKDC